MDKVLDVGEGGVAKGAMKIDALVLLVNVAPSFQQEANTFRVILKHSRRQVLLLGLGFGA